MSRSRKNTKLSDEASGGFSSGGFDHEIAQLTKLRSGTSENMSKLVGGKNKGWISPVKMLAARESNFLRKSKFSTADGCHILNRYLPVNGPYLVDQMESCAYVSHFSFDGSLLVAGYQGSHIRVYNVEDEWKVHKDIMARGLHWTITDTSLSRDKRFLVYSSMSPTVHIVDVGSSVMESLANVTEIHEGLDLSGDDDESFSIFSLKFSMDGQEIVAASSDDSIYVYDLVTNKRTLRIPAHKEDVNTVCFADESGHLIYSGSDDSFCKVWDRRCLASRSQPAGTLVGHLEGITFIDSRGDGRYFISNGKDQTIKLWDIRMMSSNSECVSRPRTNFNWDYRWMDYPAKLREMKHPNDQSLATYRGHSVLRTLIRCHFSPEYSTGQKYIYTGSNDGAVYTYDLVTGALVSKLNHHETTVRDCCWHPYYPVIVSSSWDGMIMRCEFPGSDKTPPSLKQRRNHRLYLN
ncbi:LEC14B homolog isoform X1 [Beta vulgaris subsp. vulgaris]|uniref:LEC14B homolog isoform X1 n=1 Tax=Beta vulgaris subsp. vulgaris TaxID=3555 RepID=UPI0020368F01|nr:LEC14B homolog isoform X1 [Beta vulgaris subsp. vulgaris]XP_057249682.1 LEC14B homolog isoform X1 [Beta vulgaris subsp. vulgaris]